MKIKSLEWVKSLTGTHEISSNEEFMIVYPEMSINFKTKKFVAIKRAYATIFEESILGKFKTLNEARQECQNSFNDSILSQIQPESLEEKRILAKSIDLRNNHRMKDLGNGYSQIIPIDSSKRFGDDKNTKPIHFTYRNYKGIISGRKVIPSSIYFGNTEYHKEEQWLLSGFDLDKQDDRVFAVCDIVEFRKVGE